MIWQEIQGVLQNLHMHIGCLLGLKLWWNAVLRIYIFDNFALSCLSKLVNFMAEHLIINTIIFS